MLRIDYFKTNGLSEERGFVLKYIYVQAEEDFFLINCHFKIFFMIIVHDIFICKPGNSSKLAKLFKEVMQDGDETMHIMTDMTGQFNKVVMVSRYDSLTAYEKNWEKYQTDTEKMKEMKEMKEKMKGYTDLYLTGSREIYKVW
jgi:heme-degrading monooxygenase HmoA